MRKIASRVSSPQGLSIQPILRQAPWISILLDRAGRVREWIDPGAEPAGRDLCEPLELAALLSPRDLQRVAGAIEDLFQGTGEGTAPRGAPLVAGLRCAARPATFTRHRLQLCLVQDGQAVLIQAHALSATGKRRARRHRRLRDLSTAMSLLDRALGCNHLDDLLEAIVEHLRRRLSLDWVGMYTLRGENALLAAHRGEMSGWTQHLERFDLAEERWQGGEFSYREKNRSTEHKMPAKLAASGIRALAGLPISFHDDSLALLVLADRDHGRLRFTEIQSLRWTRKLMGWLIGLTSVSQSRERDAHIFFQAFARALDPTILFDEHYRCIGWNFAAEELYGHPAHEMIGTSTARILPKEARSRRPVSLAALRAGEEVHIPQETRILKDGEQILVEAWLRPILSHGGLLLGFSETSRDLASRRRTRAQREIASPAGAVAQRNILLVEDDSTCREVTADLLRAGGHQVSTVDSGEDGLLIYAQCQQPFDLVVLDLVIPGMGGRATAEALLEIDRDCRILLITGFSHNAEVDELQQAGLIHGYLPKPYRLDDLLSAVEEAVRVV